MNLVKWYSTVYERWHFGVVVGEATSEYDPEGPYVDVEYMYSTPRMRRPPIGRTIRIYGVHKIVPV